MKKDPRIVVSYNGRLGNRLFQFAAARALSLRFKVPLAADPIEGFPGTRGFENRKSPAHPLETGEHDMMRLDYAACGRHLREGAQIVVDGYHQRYEILRPFKRRLKKLLSNVDLPAIEHPPEPRDLVVHLRLTDYFWPDLAPRFGYSLEDLRCLISRQSFDRLIVITDEPAHPFVQQLREEFDAAAVGNEPLADFALLFKAHRLILTPSTFGWWAAWLGCAEEIFFPRYRGIWNANRDIDLWVDDEPRYKEF